MEQPVICVIVPVYKAEATLPRCIESVLTQQLPGGLRLILVDDQSPDRSGEICDAYAAKDPRVMVLHRRERGVSGARNAGLRAATGEYIVFLDSDDALRPGALAAALAAQAAAPNAFVLWHYTMQPDDTTPVTTVAHPAQQSDLARLHLDCLIAMPWNKLYRRTYARQLAFDQAYTLGEDLQFVLDYLALLGRCQPDFSYLVLESALTFYDCSRTGTLSTKYHANYCEIWPKHFAKLNAACTAAACPPQDMLPLHRAELQVLAEGAADILRRDPDAMPARRAKARTAWNSRRRDDIPLLFGYGERFEPPLRLSDRRSAAEGGRYCRSSVRERKRDLARRGCGSHGLHARDRAVAVGEDENCLAGGDSQGRASGGG